jgi:hypothetical protein
LPLLLLLTISVDHALAGAVPNNRARLGSVLSLRLSLSAFKPYQRSKLRQSWEERSCLHMQGDRELG